MTVISQNSIFKALEEVLIHVSDYLTSVCPVVCFEMMTS